MTLRSNAKDMDNFKNFVELQSSEKCIPKEAKTRDEIFYDCKIIKLFLV